MTTKQNMIDWSTLEMTKSESPAQPSPDDGRVAKSDRSRLRGHCSIILSELEAGPRTNDQLIQASNTRNFSARLSNVRYWLRKHRNQDVESRDLGGGLFEYRIISIASHE